MVLLAAINFYESCRTCQWIPYLSKIHHNQFQLLATKNPDTATTSQVVWFPNDNIRTPKFHTVISSMQLMYSPISPEYIYHSVPKKTLESIKLMELKIKPQRFLSQKVVWFFFNGKIYIKGFKSEIPCKLMFMTFSL